MIATTTTGTVQQCHRRGRYSAGPRDPAGPICPQCGTTPSHLAQLDDDLVGLCRCGCWTHFTRRSPSLPWVVVERRSPQARHRTPQTPASAAIAAAAG